VTTRQGQVELVLFDLGGVLVRLGDLSAMQGLVGTGSEEESWARWLGCPWVKSLQRGLCQPEDFAVGVVSDLGLAITPAELLERFRLWPEALFDGAVELVNAVRARARVGCLSNTNSVHWDRLRCSWRLDQLFDVVFLSHEMGLLKPDRDIFERVGSVAGCPNERIAFLDDSASNVEQARGMGFQARRAIGVDQATAALVELGVLRPGQPSRRRDR
jgi:HAD superfamily hydrolase (TIGR01509 family)